MLIERFTNPMHGKCHMGTWYMKAQCPDNTKINLYYLSQASLHCPHLQPSDTEVFHTTFSLGKNLPSEMNSFYTFLLCLKFCPSWTGISVKERDLI